MPQSHQPVPVHRRVQKNKKKFNPKPSKGQTKEAMIKEWNDIFCFLFGILLACLSNIPQLHQHPTRRH
jgi:hypothetical protein